MPESFVHVVTTLFVAGGYYLLFFPEAGLLIGTAFVLGAMLGASSGPGRGKCVNCSPNLDKWVHEKTGLLGHKSWVFHSPLIPFLVLQVAREFGLVTDNPAIGAFLWGLFLGWLVHIVLDAEHPEEWVGGSTIGWISIVATAVALGYFFILNPFWVAGLVGA